jgi:hypothetical protein
LSKECYGILQNETMMKLFTSLLDKDNQFGDGAIAKAFQLFLGVFRNVHARDVAAKMNAVDYKESTVSTRPSLAGLSKTKASTANETKTEDTTAEETTAAETMLAEELNEHNEILNKLELEQYDGEEESDMDAFKICTHNDNHFVECLLAMAAGKYGKEAAHEVA